MHKSVSHHAFLRRILGQSEWDLPSVWRCWLLHGYPCSHRLRAPGSTAEANAQSLNRAELPKRKDLLCRKHQHSSGQPASPLLSSVMSLLLFHSGDISSHVSAYISDPHPAQPSICRQQTTADSHTGWAAAREHPPLPT